MEPEQKPAEANAESKPEESQPVQEDPMEKMKTLTDEEKNLSEELKNELVAALYTNNLILKSKNEGVNQLPTSLYPSPIQKKLFEKIFFYQIAFNKILNKLSNDQTYLESVLTPLSNSNNFIKKNLEISQKLVNYEKKQKIKLGIFRNDYLLDQSQNFLFLSQYKTSCSNFGSYTEKLQNFYNYYNKKYPEIFTKFKDKEIPMNKGNTTEKFTESIMEAIKLAFPQQYKDSIILFVMKQNEKNNFDIQNLCNELYDKHQIKSEKLTLNEINKKITQDENGNLILNNKKISLVYFCAGDCEEDYSDEDSWKGRELLELSTAIKVPDINTFLTSLKIFHYLLTKPDLIIHYCYNELILNDILRFFGGVYYISDLDSEKQNELLSKIQNDTNKYIFKNFTNKKSGNVTGDALKTLVSGGVDSLKNGIIFEKVNPQLHETLLFKNDNTNIENVFSEYSIYGIILMNENNLQINKSVSYLVRTKNVNKLDEFNDDFEDGNVYIDLPCLVDSKAESNLLHKVEIKAEDIQKYLDELKAAEEAKKKAEEEAKKKAEEEEAKKKAEEEEAKKKAEEENKAEEPKKEE